MVIEITGYFILFCIAVLAIFILINAFRTKRTIKKNFGAWWIRIIVIALIIALAYFFPSFRTHRLSYFSAPPLWLGILADIVVFLGLVIILWARVVLGSNWSIITTLKEKHKLVKRGPYKYVRHPMYSGFILLFLGIGLWINSIISYLIVVALSFSCWLSGKREEKLLTEHFGKEYIEYKKHTKALIPFVL